jgi:adenylate kinase family enzyme
MSTFLAVLGPPGSGKSALTNALSRSPDILVFRLRDFCLTQERRDPTLAGQLRNRPDPSGWLDDVAVGEVLAKAFREQWFPSRTARVVLLENFPGNARQVELLLGVLTRGDDLCQRLSAIVLLAPEAILRERVGRRRVCPTCEPDPHGDPHRPAVPAASRPDRCAACGAQLAVRRGDAPDVFACRLARFRKYIPSIRLALAAHGLQVRRVDATQPLARCVGEAADVLSRSRALGPLGGQQPRAART